MDNDYVVTNCSKAIYQTPVTLAKKNQNRKWKVIYDENNDSSEIIQIKRESLSVKKEILVIEKEAITLRRKTSQYGSIIVGDYGQFLLHNNWSK